MFCFNSLSSYVVRHWIIYVGVIYVRFISEVAAFYQYHLYGKCKRQPFLNIRIKNIRDGKGRLRIWSMSSRRLADMNKSITSLRQYSPMHQAVYM